MRSLFSAAVATVLVAPALAQTARPATRIDPGSALSALGGIAAYEGTTAAFYREVATQNILATRGRRCGFLWDPVVRVDGDVSGAIKTTGYRGNNPSIHASDGHVYLVWSDDRNGAATGDGDLYFNRSLDGGVTWETEQLLDKGLASGANDVKEWSMAISRDPVDANDDRVYVVISPENDAAPGSGPEDVYLVVSTDGGATFGSAISLSTANGTGADVDGVHVAANGNSVYVAWTDNRSGKNVVYFRASSDNGATFGPELALNAFAAPDGDAQFSLSIDADGSKVVLGWEEENEAASSQELGLIRVSNDGGATFGSAIVVGGYNPSVNDVDNFRAFLSGGNVVCVWEDNRAGSDQVFTAFSDDDGATWTEVQHTTSGGSFPRPAWGGDEVGIVWAGPSFPEDAQGVYSGDNGLTWTALTTLDTNTGDVDFVELTYDSSNGNFASVWLSDDLGTNNAFVGGVSYGAANVSTRIGGNPNIYTSNAPVLGETWEIEIDLTGQPGYTLAIVVAFSSPASVPLVNRGTLLVGGLNLLDTGLLPGPVASLSAPIPYEPCLVGQTVFTQAAIFGGGPYLFTNAQDLTVGGF